MDIILIRHAQPAWIDTTGLARDNPGLTELGHAQAATLDGVCARYRDVRDFWVSPTVRTRETASYIKCFEREPRVVDNFEEYRTPRWEGLPAPEVVKKMTGARYSSLDDWNEGLHGAERIDDFRHRVCEALYQQLERVGARKRDGGPLVDIEEAEQRVVMVGHAGTNGVIIAELLGVDHVPWPWERFASAHAAITRIASCEISDGHVFTLRGFNRMEHLPLRSRTR